MEEPVVEDVGIVTGTMLLEGANATADHDDDERATSANKALVL